MKRITITWRRLVDESGLTCDRCQSTENAIESAYRKLKSSMEQIGINIVLEKSSLDKDSFHENPIQSNQITIEDRTIEQWLNGTTGQSQCCGPCGDSDCRTVEVEGRVYEDIPEVLIVRACLLAAAEKLRESPIQNSCC